MKPRNREITIFNVSMLDVISGAVGAFLILMVVLFPSYQKVTGETDEKVEQENDELRAELEKLKRRAPRDEAEIKKKRRELEEAMASVTREIARVEPVSQRPPGQGQLALFASWRLPMNTGRKQDEFNAFLVAIEPDQIGDTMAKADSEVCTDLFTRGQMERSRSGHVSTDFGLKHTVVLHRAVSQTFAIYYCKWKSQNRGLERYATISSHLNYGNKVWPLPALNVVEGGKLLGVVRLLDDNRLEILEADELRGTAEKRRREYQAQRRKSIEKTAQRIRELEELKQKGKLDDGRERLLEGLKEMLSQQRGTESESTAKNEPNDEKSSPDGKNP